MEAILKGLVCDDVGIRSMYEVQSSKVNSESIRRRFATSVIGGKSLRLTVNYTVNSAELLSLPRKYKTEQKISVMKNGDR